MKFNNNTLKHFKTDGDVWEMCFEVPRRTWMGTPYLETATVVGGCYQGVWKNKEPCFRKVCYDDPPSPVISFDNLAGNNTYAVDNVTAEILEKLYRFNYIQERLVDIETKDKISY